MRRAASCASELAKVAPLCETGSIVIPTKLQALAVALASFHTVCRSLQSLSILLARTQRWKGAGTDPGNQPIRQAPAKALSCTSRPFFRKRISARRSHSACDPTYRIT